MNCFDVWRGQVPAWQCDADGQWNLRFMAGAFEEAQRLIAACGGGLTALNLPLDPATRPRAGTLVSVRADFNGSSAHLRMSNTFTGGELAKSSAEIAANFSVDPTSAGPVVPGTVPGPLGIVNAWDCDVMHHMNVQFYAGRATEAEAALSAHLGVDPANMDGPILRPVEHRFRFSGEMSAGDAIGGEVFRAGQSPVLLQARIELRNPVSGKAAASIESDLALDNANDHVSARREARRRFDALPRSDGKPAWTAGDWSPDAATLERMTPLGRQEVLPWEVDHTGVIPPRFLFGRTGSSVPYLLDQMGLNRPYMLANGFGRVAVGYRLRYLRWPRSGDCLELRSGVAKVGEKTWRFRHGFVDISDGALVCSVDAVVLLFSMTERRSVPLPADIRARAERMSI